MDTIDGLMLPFDYEKTLIFQGFNGPLSHFPIRRKRQVMDNSYCVDFMLPLGTPVLAPDDGEVMFVDDYRTDYYEGLDIRVGMLCPHNLIAIRHGDLHYSILAHLAYGCSLVDNGEQVRRGDVIAYTGKSGWVGPAPHLHFGMFLLGGPGRRSVPISFADYSGPLEHSVIWPRRTDS